MLPVGEAGAGFVEATADCWQADLQCGVISGLPVEWAVAGRLAAVRVVATGPSSDAGQPAPIPYAASSAPLGDAMAAVIAESHPTQLLVDLAALDVHDGGAGMLAALGGVGRGAELTAGVAGLDGLTEVDLEPARQLLAGVELVGVLPSAEVDLPLLGLRGITSRRGHATGADPGRLLATDAALQRLTELVAPAQAKLPGAGAAGGLGWAVLALGGRLATGPQLGLAGFQGGADLVVSGCGVFDFATRGGGVVAAAADLAGARLAPCIVIAGEVLIGAREMRTMGIEAAYGVRETTRDEAVAPDLTTGELVQVAQRVARSWRW